MFSFSKKRRRPSIERDSFFKRGSLEDRDVYTKTPKLVYNNKKTASVFEKAVFVLVVLVLFGGSFYFLFISSYFEITDVAVVGVRDSIAGDIRAKTQERIKEMRINNIFLFHPSKVEKSLVKDFYLLDSVKIRRKLPGVIKVEGKEKEPAAIIHSGTNYYFLDQDSRAFEEVSLTRLAVSSLPIIVNKGTNKKVKVGDKVLSARFMDFVLSLQEVLPRETDLEIMEISIPAFASREVHVRMKGNFLVYFDIQRTVESQVLTLKKTFSEVITEREQEQLQYVDLRVENKIFYYPSFQEEDELKQTKEE